MRYLRYCDTKANFWRTDAILWQKSTIPTTIPCDTKYDTISTAGRNLKKYKWRPDAIVFSNTLRKSTIPT